MNDDFCVVAKKGRGKKQQVSESSRLLSVLYSEGLRQQDLDADCRHHLESSSESVKAKALSHFLDMRREKTIIKPSAFLTIALINAAKQSPVKHANDVKSNAETTFVYCPSANHMLGILELEGLKTTDLDLQCQAFLSQVKPTVQTQALQDFLQQWRGGRIKNPSAYLTDLLGRAKNNNMSVEHDTLPFMDAPASVTPRPRKAPAIVAPLPFVHANTSDINVLAALKIDAVSAAISPNFGTQYSTDSLWPAVGAAERQHVETHVSKPVPENKVHNTIMRYFARQFVPMNRDELNALKMEDLEIISNVQGESGIFTALDQADGNAKMMPLYDISDEAGQTELLLQELEYAAQVIVDKLEQSGQLTP